MVEGEFIQLRSHGGLCAPTEETLLFTLKCDEGFNLMHGEGSSLKDCPDVLEVTNSFIKQLFPDIPDDFVSLFVKIKYHARIRALNEQDIQLRKEELKRKAAEKNEAPKRLKTMRDFCKESVFRNNDYNDFLMTKYFRMDTLQPQDEHNSLKYLLLHWYPQMKLKDYRRLST